MARLSLKTKTTTNDLVVNIGTSVNDKTGDPLRTAFGKLKDSINQAEANFIELYASVGADAAANELVNGSYTVSLGVDGTLNLPVSSDNSALIQSTTHIKLNANTKTWSFASDGNLTLPPGGDILSSTGSSVLGGGGTTLPASTTGYLKNNGSGTLSWDAITIPSTLGDLGITAGSNGQFLQTDGAGSYTWAYSGGYDQTLNTTDQVTFDRVITTNYTQAAEYKYTGNISGYGSAPITVAGGANTVVYSYASWFTSAKLVIQIEGQLDGDNTGVEHTQTCEATVASIYNTTDDPVMSVYGVVHTSPTPLATLTVNRNGGAIEIMAENSQTTTNLVVKVQSIQFVSRYD